jgi:hypothetical protein
MLLNWLKKDFAKDVAFVKDLAAGLSTGRAVSIPTRKESPVVDRALTVAGFGLMAFGAVLSGTSGKKSSDNAVDYVGDQWATHGHNGPFGQWTDD